MKKLLLITLLVSGIAFTSCDTTSKDKVADSKKGIDAKSKSKALAESKTIELTKEMFLQKVMDYENNPKEWVYAGDKPCIVDFYADWCGPCKRIAPILEDLAKEYEGQLYIYKVNTEKERELAQVFGIRSIPSLLFVPMKGQPQMGQGLMPKEAFKEKIDNILLKKEIK